MPKIAKAPQISEADKERNRVIEANLKKVNEELKNKIQPSANGKFYSVIAPGKVKKVAVHGLKEFIKNNDTEPLEDEFAEQNTNILLKLLRKDYPQTEFARNTIHLQGWRIQYASHGYAIVDRWNFNKRINVNKYNNDMGRPEDVLEYVKKNIKHRKLVSPPVPKPSDPVVSEASKLSGKYKVKIDKKTRSKEEQERLDKINATLKKREEAVKKRDDLVKKEKAKIKKILKPKRVKLFKGIEPDYPIAHAEEKKGFVDYKVIGPTRKIDKRLPVHVFLINQLIHEDAYPRAMAMFMRAATKGERFNLDTLSFTKFILDPYVAYDPKAILNSKHKGYLRKLAEDVMLFNQIENPLNVMYKHPFKKGDEIRVLYKDMAAWYYCTVLSTDKGLYVHAEDGSYRFVYKFQKVVLVKRPKSKK